MDHRRLLNALFALNMTILTLASPYRRSAEKHTIDMNPETHPSLSHEPLIIDVRIGEFMEITCPQFDPATPKYATLQFVLRDMHDKDAFEKCDIADKHIVLPCDRPFHPTKLTMKFQEMSPYPLGFTFHEGTSYYYTAIPLGEDDCRNAMRLIVNVLKDPEINIPPISPIYKDSGKATPLPTTTTTTAKSTVKTTTKSTPAAKASNRPQTGDGGNGSSHLTRQLTLVILLGLIGSWLNW